MQADTNPHFSQGVVAKRLPAAPAGLRVEVLGSKELLFFWGTKSVLSASISVPNSCIVPVASSSRELYLWIVAKTASTLMAAGDFFQSGLQVLW